MKVKKFIRSATATNVSARKISTIRHRLQATAIATKSIAA
jgi:hypothetical protein